MRLRWFVLLLCAAGCAPTAAVRIGSKQQPESEILAEIATLLVNSAGEHAEHQRSLGGTRVLWNALRKGEINAYPEYTGTISAEILAESGLRDEQEIRTALGEHGINMSLPLGFNDTYAIGMRKERAARLGLRTISDLRAHPELKFGFSSEFMNRADGWPGLRQHYRLPQKDVRGLNHDLAYQGLVSGTLDATDLYSTDPKIRRYDLQVLVDDLGYFPAYQAVFLYRKDLQEKSPAAVAALGKLEGRIFENAMITMNARVQESNEPESQVAADFLADQLHIRVQPHLETQWESLWRRTREHLYLVSFSLSAAIVLAVPFGILASRWPITGRGMLAATGIIQTIPSLALLVFLIPFLGIGPKPAIAAPFSLQPASDRSEHLFWSAGYTRPPPRVRTGLGAIRHGPSSPRRIAAGDKNDTGRHQNRSRDQCRNRHAGRLHRCGRLRPGDFRRNPQGRLCRPDSVGSPSGRAVGVAGARPLRAGGAVAGTQGTAVGDGMNLSPQRAQRTQRNHKAFVSFVLFVVMLGAIMRPRSPLRMLTGGQDATRYLTEADPVTIPLTPASQGNPVAVLKEAAFLAAG